MMTVEISSQNSEGVADLVRLMNLPLYYKTVPIYTTSQLEVCL